MKLALNGATTMKADLETDIKAASAAGFDGIEIWLAKLRKFLKTSSTGELQFLLTEHHLEAYSINSLEHITFRDPERHQRLLSECDEVCRLALEVSCPYLVVVPSSIPGRESREEVLEESVRVLTELSRIADQYGIALAFEFLGQPGCSVQTLEFADEIVREVARANVGLVIDSFHFYAGGSSIKSIEALDARRLFVFHINDAEDLPREELEDSHRLLPGYGILPLTEMIEAFRRIGYDGIASVEIFRPEYWERDPIELARDARVAAGKVLGML